MSQFGNYLEKINSIRSKLVNEILSNKKIKDYSKFDELLEIANKFFYQDLNNERAEVLLVIQKLLHSIIDELKNYQHDQANKNLFERANNIYRNISFSVNTINPKDIEKNKIKLSDKLGTLFNLFVEKIDNEKFSLDKGYKLIFNNLKGYQEITVYSDKSQNLLATVELSNEDSETPVLNIFSKYDFDNLETELENFAKENVKELFEKLSLDNTSIELDFSDFKLNGFDATYLESNESRAAEYKYYMLKYMKEGFQYNSTLPNGNEFKHKAFRISDKQKEEIALKLSKFEDLKKESLKNNNGLFSWLLEWMNPWKDDNQSSQENSSIPNALKP